MGNVQNVTIKKLNVQILNIMQSIYLHPADQQKWTVVDPDGMVNSFSMKGTRSDSIKRFVAVWDKSKPRGKWRHWYRKGYRCVKVNLYVDQFKR